MGISLLASGEMQFLLSVAATITAYDALDLDMQRYWLGANRDRADIAFPKTIAHYILALAARTAQFVISRLDIQNNSLIFVVGCCAL